MQPQLIAQVGARAIIGVADLHAAQEAPRWTTMQFGPGSASNLVFEPGVPAGVIEELQRRGHSISTLERPQPGWGPLSLIELDGELRRVAADPRVDTATALLF